MLAVPGTHISKNIQQLEMVQRRAARFIRHEYSRDIVTSLLEDLKLPQLQEKRKQSRVLLFQKVIHQLIAFPIPE